MTDYTSPQGRTRDIQDGTERGLWGKLTYEPGSGAHMTVRGTGTIDEEVPFLNTGYGFNLDDDSNAEVVMLALGSDPNDKVAIATIARDLQHPWAPGQGGVQSPTDPSRRLEFNGDETWLKDGSYKLGNNKEVSVTVNGGQITINVTGQTAINSSGDVVIAAPNVEITSGTLTHNGTNIGETHRHSGVRSGGSNTGAPV